MEQFCEIDVHLDTNPYSGTTITFEALYMGVPVVTLSKQGTPHVQRVSGSILTECGLGEQCVAGDESEYVTKAVSLAASPFGESDVRDAFERSGLTDCVKHTRKLENALENYVARHTLHDLSENKPA